MKTLISLLPMGEKGWGKGALVINGTPHLSDSEDINLPSPHFGEKGRGRGAFS